MRKLGLFFVTLLFSSAAFATPIHPALKELLQDAQQPQFKYMPARAGWNGPEARPKSATLNPTYEKLKYSPEALKRQLRAVILPDARALMALFFLIFALRFMKLRNLPQPALTGRRAEVLSMPSRGSAEQAA